MKGESGSPIDPLLGAALPTGAGVPVEGRVESPVSAPVATPSGPPTTTIVIGGDDDLPDATYAVEPSRSIDDPDPRRPRVDPRMKARRLAVRRAAGRRRLWWVVAAGVLVVLGLAALAVFSSSLFDVENIEVSGAVNSDPEQIAEITDDLLGQAILTADLDSIETRIETLPWVKYAQVTMDFPHTVRVQVAERTPVAAFQSADNRWRIVDLDGRVIDVLAGRPIDYVAIFGPGPDKIAGETAVEFSTIAQFVTALPPVLRPLVQSFTMDDELSVTMVLDLSTAAGGDETLVDLCAAEDLDVQQLVALMAFIETKIDRNRPPERITACRPDLVTTSST